MSQENVEIVRRWVEEQARPEFEPLEYVDAGRDAVLFLCGATTKALAWQLCAP